MCIKVELFVLTVATPETLRYVRREATVDHGSDPDAVAWSLVDARHGAEGPGAYVLHSTSWRWEEGGTVVLTYVACTDRLAPSLEPAGEVDRADLALHPSHPLRPRPERIREEDVVRHAIRHLGLLVRAPASRAIAEALTPEALAFFRGVAPGLAGRLAPDLA